MAYFHCLIGGGSSGGGYELTVTCDADFAGTTITCTDGVTTLTQTCPSASPYEVVFELPNGGDWTISGVVSGQTVSTGVNIPTTATLEAIVQKTITIYSAKEDTITYTDIYGDTQTEVFASGESSKQITIDIEPNGNSITFTSGVAKDPTNLSNAYSKTVTITSNTTDVKLMPENTLYWWGYRSDNLENGSSVNGWSWTGRTFIDSTYNTHDIQLSTGRGQLALVGNKNAISCSKVYSIARCTNDGLEMKTSTSKNVVNSITGTTSTSSSTNSLLQVSQTVTNGYVSIICQNTQVGYASAFWYE